MKRRSFTSEFKQEAASLVLDQGYSIADASKAMDVNASVMRRWVDQLRLERGGQTPSKGKAISPEQQRIQELEAKLRKVEREKEILKKATVDSIDHCNTHGKIRVIRGSLNEAYVYSPRERVCL